MLRCTMSVGALKNRDLADVRSFNACSGLLEVSTTALDSFDFSKWGLAAFDPSKWGFGASDFSGSGLADFDLPRQMVVPLLCAFRQVNTAADALFYDVALLWLRLFTRGVVVTTAERAPAAAAQDRLAALAAAAKFLNLGALANPEGAILVIDAHHRPFVEKYDDVTTFLHSGLKFPSQDDGAAPPKEIRIVTVTGVGSSALGSAAFAWNVSESLRQPVAAIVPGYGLADLIPQALGGWFGFGLHDFLRRQVQLFLAQAAPEMAKVGRRLWLSAPEGAENGAPVFRSGSPESDVLHQILKEASRIRRLYGHSKGALCIANAVRATCRANATTISTSPPSAA